MQRGLPPSNSLPSPLRIHLTATETAVVAQYASQLHAWGWRWSNSAGGDAAGVQDGWEGVGVARQGVLLTHVPSVLGTCTNAADFKVRCFGYAFWGYAFGVCFWRMLLAYVLRDMCTCV